MTFLSTSNAALTYAASSEVLYWDGNFGGAIVGGDSTGGAIGFSNNAMTNAQPGMTYSLDVFNANSSTLKLSAMGMGHYGDGGGGRTEGESIKWYVTGTLAQTFGFKFTAGAGFTGTVSIYGYN
jgi:hypothetical protein